MDLDGQNLIFFIKGERKLFKEKKFTGLIHNLNKKGV